jgi:hypothetical protein
MPRRPFYPPVNPVSDIFGLHRPSLGKMLAPDRDARLLQEYDAALRNGETTAALARRLRAEGRELGDSAGAIQTQIRKLVKGREKRQREAAFEARRWRMAMRNEPPSLKGIR